MIGAHDLICQDSACDNFGNLADAEVCEADHFHDPEGPFRDGKLWVLDDKCPTCIFRPGNLMDLDPETRDEMVAQAVRRQSTINCHSTLDGPRSVCRGFYDVHRHEIFPLRLAAAMDLIEFEAPTKE